MCLSSMHPSGVWMHVQGPHLLWSWPLQRQKKKITPTLRPHHLFTQTTVTIHFYCHWHREDVFVFRDVHVLAFSSRNVLFQNLNVASADFERLSQRLIEEQVYTNLHSLYQVIALDCALRAFQLKGFWIFFFFFESIIKCEVIKWSKGGFKK